MDLKKRIMKIIITAFNRKKYSLYRARNASLIVQRINSITFFFKSFLVVGIKIIKYSRCSKNYEK